MKFVIRADAGPEIGGGHVMRCLALAMAARDAGHDVTFVSADTPGNLIARIGQHGFAISVLPVPEVPDRHGQTEIWRALSTDEDAHRSARIASDAHWLILDHYGLGHEWITKVRRALPDIRILALDDLDRELLGADILLDPAHDGRARSQPRMALLSGPQWALLRPEFTRLRATAVSRPAGQKLLILPGMLDAAGLAPAALDAVADMPDLDIEIVMGSGSQSLDAVQSRIADRPRCSLTLDATDMAARMAKADFAIGAGGGTAWERCCLGLPSVAIAVAPNQQPGIDMLERAGAAIGLPYEALGTPGLITDAVAKMRTTRANMSRAAAALCDGQGAARVVSALSGTLRTVTSGDAQRLFDWRNQTHIREASLDPKPLNWDDHRAYMDRISTPQPDGVWLIYSEGGADIGHVNARLHSPGTWVWSYYIGANDTVPGAGKRMLTAFLRQMIARGDVDAISAHVVATNVRSARLHKDLGFKLQPGSASGSLEFRLAACEVAKRLGLPQDKGAT